MTRPQAFATLLALLRPDTPNIDLSRLFGISVATLNAYVTGSEYPTDEDLTSIAHGLHSTPEQLNLVAALLWSDPSLQNRSEVLVAMVRIKQPDNNGHYNQEDAAHFATALLHLYNNLEVGLTKLSRLLTVMGITRTN